MTTDDQDQTPGPDPEGARETLVAHMRDQGYVTPQEAASLAMVELRTVYDWVRTGRLPEPTRVRRYLFIKASDLRDSNLLPPGCG